MMSKFSTLTIVLLRVSAGWVFVYMGVNAIINHAWSLSSYTKGSIVFPEFYALVTDPAYASAIAMVLKGLLILVGVALVFGFFVRLASFIGILLMLFFYFPLFKNGYIGTEYYIVNQHIVMIFVLLHLFAARAGEYMSIGSLLHLSRH